MYLSDIVAHKYGIHGTNQTANVNGFSIIEIRTSTHREFETAVQAGSTPLSSDHKTVSRGRALKSTNYATRHGKHSVHDMTRMHESAHHFDCVNVIGKSEKIYSIRFSEIGAPTAEPAPAHRPQSTHDVHTQINIHNTTTYKCSVTMINVSHDPVYSSVCTHINGSSKARGVMPGHGVR